MYAVRVYDRILSDEELLAVLKEEFGIITPLEKVTFPSPYAQYVILRFSLPLSSAVKVMLFSLISLITRV